MVSKTMAQQGQERGEEDRLDVVTLGRAGIDLYGEQIGGRLEDMASFAKYIGGSPTNTAVGAARLGLRAGLITRVGADHFGRFIVEELNREGVVTDGVRTDPDRLTALAILGIRDPDTFPLIFYRENCADMALCAGDIDPDFVASADALLINGTHLSQPGVFDASIKAVTVMKAAGGASSSTSITARCSGACRQGQWRGSLCRRPGRHRSVAACPAAL